MTPLDHEKVVGTLVVVVTDEGQGRYICRTTSTGFDEPRLLEEAAKAVVRYAVDRVKT